MSFSKVIIFTIFLFTGYSLFFKWQINNIGSKKMDGKKVNRNVSFSNSLNCHSDFLLLFTHSHPIWSMIYIYIYRIGALKPVPGFPAPIPHNIGLYSRYT